MRSRSGCNFTGTEKEQSISLGNQTKEPKYLGQLITRHCTYREVGTKVGTREKDRSNNLSLNFSNYLIIVVSQGRFELPTFPLGGGCSIQLSY